MKKKILVFLTGTILILSLTACGLFNEKIRFGTAGRGGLYNEFGNVFSDMVHADNEDITFDVKTTAGSAANIRLLSEDYIQLAVAQTDVVNDAYYAKGTFKDKDPYRGYSAVAGLYTEACQIVVRSDSGIRTIDDLAGKRISVGEKESGTEQNAEQILLAYGLSEDMITKVNLDYTTAAEQLRMKEIDGFFCTIAAGTTIIDELSKQCDIQLLEISDKYSDRLIEAYNFYTKCTIPAGTYRNQTEDVETLGVRSVLLASDKLSADTVEKLTQVLFEHKTDLQYAVSADLQIEEDSVSEGITIPFHQGAQEYYNNQGIAINNN